MMKTAYIPGILAVLLVALLLLLVFTNFSPVPASAQLAGAASAALQATSTPSAGDGSEVGSTDGILVMGVVIVLIVTLPLMFRKQRK